MDDELKSGVIKDPRSEEEKARDYKHSDLAGAIVVNWMEKLRDEWKKYKSRYQDGSLSCVAQSVAKAVEVMTDKVMSAHPPYRSRSNYPEGGMYLKNLGEVGKKIGTTTELLDISQWQNETQMNRDITVPTPTKIGGYLFPNFKSIDEIAQAIEVSEHCILIFHCNKDEWIDIPVFNGKEIDFGHCVCAVDYFIHEGKKVLLIEDSTGHQTSLSPDKNGQRLITEDFLSKRCSGAMYLTLGTPIPPYVFTKTLRYGMRGEDVRQLQKKLGITADGIFGKNTQSAVIAFQKLHGLTPDGICGKNTNKILNL